MVNTQTRNIVIIGTLATLGAFILTLDFSQTEILPEVPSIPVPGICEPFFEAQGSDLFLTSPRDYFPPEDPERTGIFWGIQSRGYEGSIVIEAIVDGEITDIQSLTLRNEDASVRSSGIVSADAKMVRDAELIDRCEIIIANVVIDPDNLTQQESITIFVTRADGSRISDRVIILLEQFP